MSSVFVLNNACCSTNPRYAFACARNSVGFIAMYLSTAQISLRPYRFCSDEVFARDSHLNDKRK